MHSNWLIYLVVGIFLWGLFVGFFYSRNTPSSSYIWANVKKATSTIIWSSGAVVGSWTSTIISDQWSGSWWNITIEPKKYILMAFDKVKTNNDFDKFENEFWAKKHWIYLIAAKTKDKSLWTKYWNFEFYNNKILQSNFWDQAKFATYVSDFYKKIVTDSVEVDTPGDISMIFINSNVRIEDAIKSCNKADDPKFFTEMLYAFRANSTNQYCEKINIETSPSMHYLCSELIQD